MSPIEDKNSKQNLRLDYARIWCLNMFEGSCLDRRGESLKAPRVPKLPLADTPDLEPPSLSRKARSHMRPPCESKDLHALKVQNQLQPLTSINIH